MTTTHHRSGSGPSHDDVGDVDLDDATITDRAPTTRADAVDTAGNPVWADTWNPKVNEFDPHAVPHRVAGDYGIAQPEHWDQSDASPMINAPGHDHANDEGGVTPDPRMNLLDSVRVRGHAAVPEVIHRHIVETSEAPVGTVNVRQFALAAGGAIGSTPTLGELLEKNNNRQRAFIRNITPSNKLITPANPTAGSANATIGTVPVGCTWAIKTIELLFTADANVATRQVKLRIIDAGGREIGWAHQPSAGVTAGQAVVHEWAEGFNNAPASDANPASTQHFVSFVPTLNAALPAGTVLSIQVANVQVGDAITAVAISVTETSSVFLVPRDSVGASGAASSMGWALSNSDAPFEVKTSDGIDVITADGNQSALLVVWEELNTPSGIGV